MAVPSLHKRRIKELADPELLIICRLVKSITATRSQVPGIIVALVIVAVLAIALVSQQRIQEEGDPETQIICREVASTTAVELMEFLDEFAWLSLNLIESYNKDLQCNLKFFDVMYIF